MKKYVVIALILLFILIFIIISIKKPYFIPLPKFGERYEIENRSEFLLEIPPPPFEVTEKELSFPYASPEYSNYNVSRKINLEIFDICSGKMEESETIGEGGIKVCLNEKPPYYIILKKFDSFLNTSFYEGKGFEETYNFTQPVTIFYIFIQDLLTVPGWEGFEIFGDLKDHFSLGDYHLINIWEPSAQEFNVTKQIVSLPLIAHPSIQKTGNWSSLEFYLKKDLDLYYIGKLWLFVV